MSQGSSICNHDRCRSTGIKKQKAHTQEKENEEYIFFYCPNVLSMDRHDKLMGYQNNTFPSAVYGCMDTASPKLLFIRAWSSNNNPVYPARWYFEYLYESKTLPDHIRIDKGSEMA